jgi:hypothetical protein
MLRGRPAPRLPAFLSIGVFALPEACGYRVPTKLGFKNPKHIVAIEVTNV